MFFIYNLDLNISWKKANTKLNKSYTEQLLNHMTIEKDKL